MGRIVVTEFVSLDGVMEDPGGSENFEYGGWSFEISRGEEGDKFKIDETLESEALLLGRVTYEGFADASPTRSGEFADKFNQHAQVRRLLDVEGSDVEQLDGARGRRRGRGIETETEISGDIVVHGSRQLVQTLLDRDLVDELRLMVYPVVLGKGKRLFGQTSGKKPLRLVEAKTVGDGVTILIHKPAAHGEHESGSD